MKKVYYKGYNYKAENNESLVKKIAKEYKKIKIKDIASYVEENAKEYTLEEKEKSELTFKKMVAGASAIINVTKGSVVTQAEINRRASICQSCKEKGGPGVVSTGECRPCGFAARLATWINNVKRDFGKSFTIPNNFEDKGCGSCMCSLAVMLPSKISAFDYEKDSQNTRPDHCWVKKTGNNFIEL